MDRRNAYFGYKISDAAAAQLSRDPDPFVRACLLENQTHASWSTAETLFGLASHLERLALVRNPDVATADKLIWKIFDIEDTEESSSGNLGRLMDLGIDQGQRRELALAFLSNPNVQVDSRRTPDTDEYLRIDGYAYFSTRERWAKVWKFAAKWSAETGVPQAVFTNVATEAEVKEGVYRIITEPRVRVALLEGCVETDQRTIALGLDDSDDTCRFIAFSKIWSVNLPGAKFQAVLDKNDNNAMWGMAVNKSLPIAYLKKLSEKFEEMHDYLNASIADRTIRDIVKKQNGLEDEETNRLNGPVTLTDDGQDANSELKKIVAGLEKTRRSAVLKSRWIGSILVLTAAGLIIGAPLEGSLAFCLLCIAATILFIGRKIARPS